MPETAKEKKIRLYKYASEYNLSTDSIIELLQKKGHEVKGHMSILTDEMIEDIKSFFKKDIEKAEKHYKKISEFQKKRTDRTEAEHEAEAVVETVEPPVVEKEVPVEEPVVTQQEVVEEVVEQQPIEETVVVEPEPEPEIIVPEEKVEEVVHQEEQLQPEVEEAKPFRTQSEIALDVKKKGLTIVGKIDLSRKPKPVEKQADGQAKPAA